MFSKNKFSEIHGTLEVCFCQHYRRVSCEFVCEIVNGEGLAPDVPIAAVASSSASVRAVARCLSPPPIIPIRLILEKNSRGLYSIVSNIVLQEVLATWHAKPNLTP